MLGFSRRVDGKIRHTLIVSSATGRDREPVRRVKAVLGKTCPACGSEAPIVSGTMRNRVRDCTDPFHTVSR
jgi:hypothetical protein